MNADYAAATNRSNCSGSVSLQQEHALRWPSVLFLRSSTHDIPGNTPLAETGRTPRARAYSCAARSNDMTNHQAARQPTILGIGGTTRPRSSGELALRYCLRIAERAGAHTELLTAQDLQLAMYDPAPATPDPNAGELIDRVHRADALIIASPAYHAGISGLVKNTLDHLEDLRLADPPYLEGKAVACITTSRGAQGGALTLTALRSVVHALRGWPTPLGVVIDTSSPAFGPDGEPLNETTRHQLRIATAQVLAATRMPQTDNGQPPVRDPSALTQSSTTQS